MIHSIYTKIFLWFWLALLGVTVSVTLITFVSGSQPLGRRWMSLTTDVCAHSAVDFYLQGGKPALKRYIDEIERSSPIRMVLFDPHGQDILGRGVPPEATEVLEKAQTSGSSQFSMWLHWTGASFVPTPEGKFTFVAYIFPLRGFWRQNTFEAYGLKLSIALLATGLLCLVLARHIANPIRALQAAARQIADGDLSVRASPAISPRSDELADLAQDFDRMAERMQSLLRKQQELLGDISHELRSPLTRLNVSLELVRRGEINASDRMQQDLDRLDAMIGQILTLTRLQASEGQKIVTSVNLRLVLESVAADARFEGEEQGKSVSLTRADDCWLSGDPALLRSCIENVVRNAVRYTKPKTAVELSLKLEERNGLSSAQVLIADHGEGVPVEALPRLFEPFYRMDDGCCPTHAGVGGHRL